MIGLVDYGAGNMFSVRTALERVGWATKTVGGPADLAGVDRMILPGVGQFGEASDQLKATGLFDALVTWAASGRPLLGICLGMQLLFEGSEEDEGRSPGLGILGGRVVKLRGPRRLHMGWNTVLPTGPADERAVCPGFYYYVHEFAPRPEDRKDIIAISRFGDSTFPAAVGRGLVLGVQFHPEKSGPAGLEFLARWAEGRLATTGANRKQPRKLVRTLDPKPENPMPAVRIIPCLDMDDGRVVKGVRFENLRDAGEPVERARHYGEHGADELCLLDVGATWKSRRTLLEIVKRVSQEIFIPLTVGGGLRSVEDIREALMAGADKVSLGTAAVENPDLLGEAAGRFGRQCLVVSVDAKANDGNWTVTTHGGRRMRTLDAVTWARQAEEAGAGEILLNSIDRDGTAAGYDLELIRRVRDAVTIPVIASGGGNTPAHAWNAVNCGRADAILLASVLHDGRRTIQEFKAHLRTKGVFIR